MKAFVAALALSSVALMGQTAPRRAPEFSINMPGAKPILLSQYRGKVTLVEFLSTTCPHCQHASQLMSRLQTEYGPKGFQPVGVAFNDGAEMLVPAFVRDFKVTYPVGYAARETVYNFLKIDPNLGLHVPQIVIIDRNGMIRHQSMPREDSISATEQFLRKNIETLLAEPATRKSSSGAKKASAKKTASQLGSF
jgi:thiol-disulfide isomerase/thioredoxin